MTRREKLPIVLTAAQRKAWEDLYASNFRAVNRYSPKPERTMLAKLVRLGVATSEYEPSGQRTTYRARSIEEISVWLAEKAAEAKVESARTPIDRLDATMAIKEDMALRSLRAQAQAVIDDLTRLLARLVAEPDYIPNAFGYVQQRGPLLDCCCAELAMLRDLRQQTATLRQGEVDGGE